MKKEKLTLAELKVQSFVTGLENTETETIQGGVRILTLVDINLSTKSINVDCELGPIRFKVASPAVEAAADQIKKQHKKNITSFGPMKAAMGRFGR